MRAAPRTGHTTTPHAPEAATAPRVSQPKAQPKLNPAPQAAPEGDPPPLKATWLVQPTLYDTVHNWLADVMPFSWRERARRYGYWRRRAIPAALVLVGVIIAVLVGNFGISLASQVTHALASAAIIPQQQATPGSVIISPLNNTAGTPTPSAVSYSVGVWISNTMPAGGSVTVFVRVSHNGAAVARARVYIQALTGNGGGTRLGPITTDAYGMASANLHYGAGQGTPVFLTATTTINSATYTGTYTFVAY